jgi:adenylylsulfate kinase
MAGIALWITGLPGSGKSAYADRLKKSCPQFVLLRMDDLRKTATPLPTYSEAERDILYRSLVYMAKTLVELGHDVLIDATGNLRRWRELARGLIPGYREVYLRCPVDVCMEREGKRLRKRGAPTGVYGKAKKGWPVPGITAPYEEPVNPDLTIDTDKTTIRRGVEIIISMPWMKLSNL